MSAPIVYEFPRYLAAKKSVDDRALNRGVWEALMQALPKAAGLRIVEVGAGIGTMVERWLDWSSCCDVHYTAIDALPENIAAARQRLAGRSLPARLTLEAADLFEYLRRPEARQAFDLLIANAFLDLMDIPATLPQIFQMLIPGGLFYFTINFDGVTLFEPPIDPEFDALVVALYHRSMDERLADGRRSGDSRAGRRMFHYLKQTGADILAAGPSDWVVFPRRGCYPADEAYFLHFILHFFETTLAGHPQLDPQRFTDWIATRRRQVEQGELVYIAHQLDFVGRI
jgi:SAM-dependent methyltransferase